MLKLAQLLASSSKIIIEDQRKKITRRKLLRTWWGMEGEGFVLEQKQPGIAMEGSNSRKTAGALLLPLSYHCLKIQSLLPCLLQLRSMLQVASGIKSGHHRSPVWGTELKKRWELILDILFPTLSPPNS